MSNPFISAEPAAEEAANDLPLLKEWGWDFQHDCFIYNDRGVHVTVTENEALKVWIYKCLKTERYLYDCYRHGIYDADCDYGVELEQYIGKSKNNEETADQITIRIKEAFSVNPYILSVDAIDIVEMKGDQLKLQISLTSIYGAMRQEVTV